MARNMAAQAARSKRYYYRNQERRLEAARRHRKRQLERHRQRMKKWYDDNPCVVCLEMGIIRRADDAHHRDPATKKFKMSGAYWVSDAKFHAEGLECDGVCA